MSYFVVAEKLVANMSAINKYNLAESILNESFVIRESLSNDSMNVQFKQCRMLAPLYYESGKYVQSSPFSDFKYPLFY